MTVHQRYAVAILRQQDQPGVVTAGATAIYDGQPWINYRTARALHDRGLVVFNSTGDFVYLLASPRKLVGSDD